MDKKTIKKEKKINKIIKNTTITIKSKSGITYKIDKATKRIKVKKAKKFKSIKKVNPFGRKNKRNFENSRQTESTAKIDKKNDDKILKDGKPKI